MSSSTVAANAAADGDANAISTSSGTVAASAAKSAIDFLTLARGLKTTLRTGWIRQAAGPKIESVADHSWRIALMSWVAASSTTTTSNYTLDCNKCLKMALIHDLAEAQVGDITPHCGVSDTDKHQQELSAMIQMTNHLTESASSSSSSCTSNENNTNNSNSTIAAKSFGRMVIGQEMLDLWKEYEEGTSPEAKLVKDMDKLEMILQALEYEQDGNNKKSLDGFFDSTRNKWRTEIGTAWGEEIEARRRQPSNKVSEMMIAETSKNDRDDNDTNGEPETKRGKTVTS